MIEVCNSEQKGHTYLYSEIFKNCKNVCVLYGLEIRLCLSVGISANYVIDRKSNARMNPPSYQFIVLGGFCLRLVFFYIF